MELDSHWGEAAHLKFTRFYSDIYVSDAEGSVGSLVDGNLKDRYLMANYVSRDFYIMF